MFPNQRALDENGLAGLEEERRLAYVGLTRARKQAIISAAANRRVYNQWVSSLPSRFIDELPKQHIRYDQSNSTGGLPYTSTNYPSSSFTQATGGYESVKNRAIGQRTAGRRNDFVEGVSFEVKARALHVEQFAIGERVFHQKFGYGRIEDMNADRLEINFEQAGPKTVIASFVEKI